MSAQRSRSVIDVSYQQIHLAPPEVDLIFDALADESATGPLIGPAERHGDVAAIIMTGCSDGPVDVTLEVLDGPPGPLAPEWEVSEERDLRVEGTLYVTSPTVYDLYPPEMRLHPTGSYRFRISGRDRHVARKLVTFTVTEYYLIQAWPTSNLQAPRILLDDHMPA